MSDPAYLAPTSSLLTTRPPDPTNTPAPVPKAEVPTIDTLVRGTQAPSLDGASTGTLLGAAKEYADRIFDRLSGSQASAFAALAEPPPPPDEELAIKILGLIAEGVGEVLLGRLGAQIVDGLKTRAAGATVDAVKDLVRTMSRKGGAGIGDEAEQAAAGETAPDAGQKMEQPLGDPAAKTMLDQYRAMQRDVLGTVRTRAHVRLLLVQDAIARVDRAEVACLADALGRFMIDTRNFTDYEFQIATGWMNFCASSAIARARPASSMRRPRALEADGDGFMTISIDVPERAYGLAGLRLDSAHLTNAGPGLIRLIHGTTRRPLLSVPVHRRVHLAGPGSKLNSEWAFVIKPDGTLEIDDHSALLAVIGRASPAIVDDSTVGAGNADPAHARAGAELVVSWLSTFKTEVIR